MDKYALFEYFFTGLFIGMGIATLAWVGILSKLQKMRMAHFDNLTDILQKQQEALKIQSEVITRQQGIIEQYETLLTGDSN